MITRLHLRFALTTALALALAGVAMTVFVRGKEVAQAETDVTQHAQYVERSILKDELTARDITQPVSGLERKRLDWLFDARVLIQGGLRVKLYRQPDGLVTYSNDHGLIGTHADDLAEFRSVLSGRVKHDVAYLNHEGGAGKNVKTLEVYVPLQLRDQSRPSGVFELYQSYAPVARSVRAVVMPFMFILLAGLLVLWIGLFPLLSRMARRLERDRAARQLAEEQLVYASEQLRQAQKMDAIGRLAGGVAHDFNNLLLAINGYSEFLTDTLTDPRLQGYAREIRDAGVRGAALTQQLLAFSRRQVLQPQVINLNDAVLDIESMLRRLIGEGVTVQLDLDAELQFVKADPGQIGQVLLNLAINARDAMDGRGVLRIRTRNRDSTVVLEVADTGHGMDEETRSRIFEPFFTTKSIGEGTGLGLSTAYGIVTQSGGTIEVRSAPGEGAVFSVCLPATNGLPAAGRGEAPTVERGRERVLVVDDEPVVGNLVGDMLRELGYDVAVAGSSHEAMTLGGGWDLLVTDVVMPHVDGVALAERIHARRVLFVSGYDQANRLDDTTPLLHKPFTRDELARAVRELLDRTTAAAA